MLPCIPAIVSHRPLQSLWKLSTTVIRFQSMIEPAESGGGGLLTYSKMPKIKYKGKCFQKCVKKNPADRTCPKLSLRTYTVQATNPSKMFQSCKV